MTQLELKVLRSAAELRAAASQWDDLWGRSEVTLPLLRAVPIARWVEHFGCARSFAAHVVVDDGRFVCALPLVRTRIKGIVPSDGVPNDPWALCGDLLVDPQADVAAVLRRLIESWRASRCPLMWSNAVPFETPRWQALLAVCSAVGLPFTTEAQVQVGVVDIDQDWDGYLKSWSRNRRRTMKRASDKAAQSGGVQLKVERNPDPAQIGALVKRGFEVEDRGWKAVAGTSVLRSPGRLEFFTGLARDLAATDNLELVYLEHQQQPIAFEYGFRGKRTYFAAKVGYDEQFSRLVPGQLLRYHLFREFFGGNEIDTIDFHGTLVEATAKWSTRSYPIGRVLIGARGPAGHLLVSAYKHLLPLVRKVRGHKPAAPEPAEAAEDPQPAPAGPVRSDVCAAE